MQRIVEKWRLDYEKAIPGHLENLQQMINGMKSNMSEETLKSFRIAIHKMAGSAGTVGFMNVSDLCKRYDLELSQRLEAFKEIPDKSKWVDEYQGYLEEIKKAFSDA